MTKGKYLGLDFGDKRVGIAVSDLDKIIAFPRGFLSYEVLSEFLQQLKTLCKQEGVTKIIIGLPIGMDGSIGEQVTKTYGFGQKLHDALPQIPVEYFDERLTTKAAEERLREQGIKAKHQKGQKDALSAQLILETYLKTKK